MTDLTIAGSGAIAGQADLSTHPAVVYLASLDAARSRTVVRRRLNRVARLFGLTWDSLPWQELDASHVLAVRGELAKTQGPDAVNATISAIRGVARWAWRLGMMDAERLARIVDVGRLKGERIPAGRGLTPGELAALMAACGADTSPVGARDAAIIALGYAGGLRRAEISALDLSHVGGDEDTLLLTVMGKGNKQRQVPLDNGPAAALLDWLKARGDAPGALFWRSRKGGRIVRGERLSAQSIRSVCRRRAEQAGVEYFSPHDLRRSFVSDLLDAGADIATVANMAGHANIETTRRYDRRGERAMKQAASLLHLPYTPRG